MSTASDDKQNGRVLAFWLVLVHFVAGLICGAVCQNTMKHTSPVLMEAAFIGLVFSQASLLGLWGGLGAGRSWLARLVGVLVGLIYLGGLFCLGIREVEIELVLMIVLAGLSVAGLLTVCRCFGLGICPIGVDRSYKTAAQFSIRHLMLLTLVVACVMALAKWLQPHVDIDGRTLKLFVIAVPFVILGFVAVWAVLGMGHPRLGIVAVLLLAPPLGFVGQAVVRGPGWWFWIAATATAAFALDDAELAGLWMTGLMTEALVLVVSLYAIRRCGFRVRRQPKGEPGSSGKETNVGSE